MDSRPLPRIKPIALFYVLAFFISWLGWVPQALYNRGIFPFDTPLFNFLGAAGPTLAAVITLWAMKGKDGPRKLFSPLIRWRISWRWYLFVFLFWFVAAGIALFIMAAVGRGIPALTMISWSALLPIFITMLLSNIWEEIGWRGFALPELQTRFNDLSIATLMGLLWSLWHLPLLLNPTSPLSGLSWVWEVIFSLAQTVLYIWLYNHTRGSLLFVSIFHAMSNTVAYLLLELDVFVSSYPFVVSLTAVFALAIVLIYGPQKFDHKGISQ